MTSPTLPPTRFADRIAIGVAVACGVHCLCIPILLGISALAGLVGRISEPLEYGFLGCSFLLGTGNLLYSYRNKHHRPECLLLFGAGFFMVAVRDHVLIDRVAVAVGIGGGLFIVMAHFHNLQLCRKATCCCGNRGCNPQI